MLRAEFGRAPGFPGGRGLVEGHALPSKATPKVTGGWLSTEWVTTREAPAQPVCKHRLGYAGPNWTGAGSLQTQFLEAWTGPRGWVGMPRGDPYEGAEDP